MILTGGRGEKRSLLFLLDIAAKKDYELTPVAYYDVPPVALGSSFKMILVFLMGKEVVFTANKDKMLAIRQTTMFGQLTSSLLRGGSPTHVKISKGEGNDCEPVYSPDGKYIAFFDGKKRI